jgi:signal transduction histidine kinase
MRDASGQVIGINGVVEEITEIKRIEEEIRALNADLEARVAARTADANAASQAKSEFLSHMSHEIRTPMNGVLGLTQLLARQPLTNTQRDLVARIQDAGQSLLAIINDILDFSKIEAGQLRLEVRPFRLEDVKQKVENLLRPVAATKGLDLRIEPPTEPLDGLLGDALRLEQVLINLIGNAIKFTERGAVTLRIARLEGNAPGARLRFEIRDTGIGMDAATLTGLFQPFTQAEAGITRRFGGTGLGLSISRRLVELMGGAIGVESTTGHGSVFWFELPFDHARAGEAEATAAPVRERPAGPRLPGLRILAVDDSPMNRYLVERLLTLEGARVTLADDGQQAVQRLRIPDPASRHRCGAHGRADAGDGRAHRHPPHPY